jgi:hypothetical protein
MNQTPSNSQGRKAAAIRITEDSLVIIFRSFIESPERITKFVMSLLEESKKGEMLFLVQEPENSNVNYRVLTAPGLRYSYDFEEKDPFYESWFFVTRR